MVTIRNDLRAVSASRNVPADERKQLFALSDRIRDRVLVDAGVKLNDVSPTSSEWRFDPEAAVEAAAATEAERTKPNERQ